MGFRAGTLCYVVWAALALALSQIPCREGKVIVQDPQPKAQTPKKRTLLDYFSVPTHKPGWGAAWQLELTGGHRTFFYPQTSVPPPLANPKKYYSEPSTHHPKVSRGTRNPLCEPRNRRDMATKEAGEGSENWLLCHLPPPPQTNFLPAQTT